MKSELEKKFADRWPKWFNMKGDIRHTLMPFGFPGDGWFDLIWKLCEDIEPLVDGDFEVLQVKEKFGGLRFYVSATVNAVFERIAVAERESYKTCEYCGKSGEQRNERRWIKTLCDECNKPTLETKQ